MKNLFLFCLSLLWINAVSSQSLIASELFENSVTLFTRTGTGSSFLTGASVSPTLPASSNYFAEGSYGLAVTNGTTTLISNAINTSAFSNIQLSLRIAAFAVTGTNGLDQTDRVTVSVSSTGGSFYFDLVTITGATIANGGNSSWGYTATGIASTPFPTAVIHNAPSSGVNANGFSTAIITNIPAGDDIRIKLLINCNANERWVVDNVRLTGIANSLPVKLLSFNLNRQDDKRLLEWSIASPETGCKYELTRSYNGTDFVPIDTRTGDALQIRFKFSDVTYSNSKTYYRLKMTSPEGEVTYSHILAWSADEEQISYVYPNPVKDLTTLHITNKALKGTTAILFNIAGIRVRMHKIINDYEIIDMSNLAPGSYFLRLNNGSVFRVIKE